jgi:transcriptional regulator with XRE-family HTH domain
MVTMSQDPLKTYLLTYRKRMGLSQDELAFLLGIDSGTTVSKHETGARKPLLKAALSYEIILGEPAAELFAGWYLELRLDIRTRAAKLRGRLSALEPSPANAQKLKSIQRLLQDSLEAGSI